MIKTFDAAEQLYRFAANKFVEIANDAIVKRGRFSVALAGGSTPKRLYQLLASDEYKITINWNSVFFFFGDERNVSPASDDSNFKLAKLNLFESLSVDQTNIYRWQTELKNPEQIAADYEQRLKNFFPDFPEFDLILLGMGDDGHTVSLFPFTDALNETEKLAVANPVEKLAAIRLTLTFPVINHARNVIFLVKGADKAEILREVLEGEFKPEKLPSQNVKPHGGKLFWLIESEAARLLQ